MSRDIGRALTERRRSNAAGVHGRKSPDRYNAEREAIADAMKEEEKEMSFPCPHCGADTKYQMFSGGQEYYCPQCNTTGSYPREGENLPRATLLRTPEGRVALRAQMDQELARLNDQKGESGEDAGLRGS